MHITHPTAPLIMSFFGTSVEEEGTVTNNVGSGSTSDRFVTAVDIRDYDPEVAAAVRLRVLQPCVAIPCHTSSAGIKAEMTIKKRKYE